MYANIKMKNYYQHVNMKSSDVLNGCIQIIMMFIILTNEFVLIFHDYHHT